MRRHVKILISLCFIGSLAATNSCSEEKLSDEKDILSFTVAGETEAATINTSNMTVVVEVECGTDLVNLAPTFAVSEGATSSPASGTPGDYSDQVSINVTAEDGSSAEWKVTISEACANATDILAFSFPEETGAADIDNDNHTIDIEVEYGADLASLTPTFTLSEGASSDPASGTEGDYSSEVTITVTAEDAVTKQDWTIEVTVAAPEPSSAADILDFILSEQTKMPVIDNANNSISVEVANGTDLTTLAPVLTISPGATSNPASGETGDYSSAKVIEVTAEDGETIEGWTVNVSERPPPGGTPSSEADILTFTIPDLTHHVIIDDDIPELWIFVEEISDLTNVAATFTLSPGATANPPSGTPRDYSGSEFIIVTAEDGTTQKTWQTFPVDGIHADEVCYWYAHCQDEESMNICMIAYNECIARYGKESTKACAILADIVCELGESND